MAKNKLDFPGKHMGLTALRTLPLFVVDLGTSLLNISEVNI